MALEHGLNNLRDGGENGLHEKLHVGALANLLLRLLDLGGVISLLKLSLNFVHDCECLIFGHLAPSSRHFRLSRVLEECGDEFLALEQRPHLHSCTGSRIASLHLVTTFVGGRKKAKEHNLRFYLYARDVQIGAVQSCFYISLGILQWFLLGLSYGQLILYNFFHPDAFTSYTTVGCLVAASFLLACASTCAPSLTHPKAALPTMQYITHAQRRRDGLHCRACHSLPRLRCHCTPHPSRCLFSLRPLFSS